MINTELNITYTYYEEGYGALDEAEKIIINKFGNNHIIPFSFCNIGRQADGARTPFIDASITVKTDLSLL